MDSYKSLGKPKLKTPEPSSTALPPRSVTSKAWGCVLGGMVSPKRYGTCKWELIWKKGFADVIKDLETKSSWAALMGPVSSDTCLYKRHKKRRHRRVEGHVQVGAETGVLQPQLSNVWSPQKLEEARDNSPLEPAEGAQPCRHFDCRPLVSKTVEE